MTEMSKANTSFLELLQALRSKRMLTVFLLGFSSGLPIMVVYGSIKLWLKREGIDLSTIGYFSWIAMFYSYNFLWAFLFDRYQPFKMGRRKSWLLITQVGIALSFVLLSLGDPHTSIPFIAIAGGLLCFWSASQDVAVDAYRNEILEDNELGVGASLGVYGYRIGMWVASGFGIWITDQETWAWSFNQMFQLMAVFSLIGVGATLWAEEPKMKGESPQNLRDSVVLPFLDFFKRSGSLWILFFIFLYKFGDSFAGSMNRPYYADLGFSNKDIGEIASTLGLFSSLLGLIIGGSIIFRYGFYVSLWISGILQALSTACFALLPFYVGKLPFAFVVFFEDVSSGMGTAALVAFMGYLSNKRFTATQYALFASLASLGRTLFAGFAGNLIQYLKANPWIGMNWPHVGYIQFYIFGALLAIPALLFLPKFKTTMMQAR
jgi:PAT family beta-lactamase induction signal transducer AmpG